MQNWSTAKYPLCREILVEDLEPLIHLVNKTKYFVSDMGRRLAEESTTYNEDFMQKKLYYLLKQLNEEQYAFCREWIIGHPLLKDRLELLSLKEQLQHIGLTEVDIDSFIKNAYEEIPSNVVGECGYCGWTVEQYGLENYCIELFCRERTDNFSNKILLNEKNNIKRLRSGVMKYMMLPGRFEIELAEYCEVMGYGYELWPQKDAYDLKISISDVKYAVDIKSYFSPFNLRHYLKEKGVFNGVSSNMKKYIVIPDYHLKKTGYIDRPAVSIHRISQEINECQNY